MKLRAGLLAFFVFSASALAQQPYVTTIAAGFVPWDQNPIALQQFLNPTAVAYDPQGNLYYTDSDNVWRLNADGSNTLLAQIPGSQPGVVAIAVDSNQNIYIADLTGRRIWKVAKGVLSVFAAQGALYNNPLLPTGLAVGVDGTVYVSSFFDIAVLSFPPEGGAPKVLVRNTQQLISPTALAILGNTLFIYNSFYYQILADDLTTGALTPIFGYGAPNQPQQNAVGAVNGIAAGPSGTLFFSATDHVYQLDLSTNAFPVYAGASDNTLPPEANGQALQITMNPTLIAASPINGDLAAVDIASEMVRVVRSANQNVEAVAGLAHFAGDGGPAVLTPNAFGDLVATDSAGNIYFSEAARIRKFNTGGTIETIAGDGVWANAGDGKSTVQASLEFVSAMAVDPAGSNIFWQSHSDLSIRKIDRTGIISTIAGAGSATPADGMPAIQASIPGSYLAADSSGNLYISAGAFVWRMDSSGILHRFAGGSCNGPFTENGVATQQCIVSGPIVVDNSGNVYFGNGASIVAVNTSGRINTIPGSAPSSPHRLCVYTVTALALDTQRNLYFSRYPDSCDPLASISTLPR